MKAANKWNKLIEKAFEAREHAYVPYSGFRVGACILTTDGTYILGANIENAAYGSTNCAERSAVFSAYSQGYRKEEIEALAIVTEADKLTTPCGACRQVLSELLKPETPIVLSNHLELAVTTIAELLPDSFGAGDLKAEQNR
ncbi:MAG: cytidine deaminase [Lachnospiraceae bacterium]|jgi:cytidine deaminase|nr:cytidine deaminase [Lachnospiraceae bacterium]